ncbi:ABC transporter permease [Microbacterium trichothecenolyticum]|uniref:ABC transporter permease n=1 Tax=Microbacterium trichothecenolyticum TaxID=69370 RepID=UPI001C6E862C|nr:ABC transporter permease [Microbacterium trichothecenolyticum]MBW9121933.1 ABC transporter permease [Microbacterium trichothecenolyticum]
MSRLRSFWHDHRSLSLWLLAMAAILVACVLGPLVTADPYAQDPTRRLLPPGEGGLLGTDGFGRDVFARVVGAGQVSLGIAAVIAAAASIAGSIIGLVSGYSAATGAVLMRGMDALMAFPGIVLSIALVTAIGPGAFSEIFALTVVFTPLIARVIRSRALSLASRGYITAARSTGMAGWKILAVHILPNALPTILVQAVLVFAAALLLDGTLSFLGMGVQAPTPTWGNMIAEARPYLTIAPMFVIAPGLAIVLVVVVLNAIGNGVRDVVDPRTRALSQLVRIRRRSDAAARRTARTRVRPTPVTAPR